MNQINHPNRRTVLIAILIISATIRLATLGAYPLTDNTEARYAEVAREMVASGDWVTPQLHGAKFWAKPPLSIWLTAMTMSLFGTNEFAARLSPFFLSLLVVWLTYKLAIKRRDRDHALVASVILISSVLFFINSGAVMTDAALALGTTLSMTAFWLALNGKGKQATLWGYLFFVGQAIGLLSKGPVCIVLTFLPIGLWVVWRKRWRVVLSRIPWIGGLLLTAALTLPWYMTAEARTPGFLDYFLIGEHWRRYAQPGWAGDLYGSAHVQPRGMIWLFWIIAAFPWSMLFFGSWVVNVAKRRSIRPSFHTTDEWSAYLILWAVAPMLFFTFARNILWTYALTGLPAFALLMAQWWPENVQSNAEETLTNFKWPLYRIACTGFSTPLIVGLLILVWSFTPIRGRNSQKDLVSCYQHIRTSPSSRLIYLYDRPYSAEFYSSGHAIQVTDASQLKAYFDDSGQDFYAIKQCHILGFLEMHKNIECIGTYDEFSLFRKRAKAHVASEDSKIQSEKLKLFGSQATGGAEPR